MTLSLYALVYPGMEKIAQQEIQELLGVGSDFSSCLVAFSMKKKEESLRYLRKAQTPRRVLLALGTFSAGKEVSLPEFPWQDIFVAEMKYGIELEHLTGQELRQSIMRNLGEQLSTAVKKKCNYVPKFTFKNPEVLLVLHYTGKEYVLGIDLAGEMHGRAYRIFTHHASFTGDVGYSLVRKVGFVAGEKLLIGWAKDGTLAIEAALFSHQLPVQKGFFSCEKFPIWRDRDSSVGYKREITEMTKITETTEKNPAMKISAFDISLQNITAARKNAKLAGVYELIDFQKYSLDELDVKYGEAAFDKIIFHLTVKDEPKLNELYYQMKYILKPKGTVLFITRKQLDLPVPEGFTLLSEEELKRGESVQKVWIMTKILNTSLL